jgi:hypothetical protein
MLCNNISVVPDMRLLQLSVRLILEYVQSRQGNLVETPLKLLGDYNTDLVDLASANELQTETAAR